MFFGGETVLKIKGALQWVNDVLMKYDRFMEPINTFSRMMNGLPLKEQKIMNHKKSQKVMKVLIKDILRTLVLLRYECESPKYIQDLVLFHHASTSRVRSAYDELVSAYKWLDCMVKHDASNTLNITNIAVLFCHSDAVVFMMSTDYILSEPECDAIVEDLVIISEMALAVKISFVWNSGMPQDSRTNLRDAVLGLYGKNCVHHFGVNSASFHFEDAAFDVEAQEAVQSRIELMIQLLEHTSIRNLSHIEAQKPDEKIKIEAPKQIRITKEDIASIHHDVVSAICRKNVLLTRLSQDMLNLIVFFYAKPIILRLRFDGETKPIALCPVESDLSSKSGWNYVRKKVKEAFSSHRFFFSYGTIQSVSEDGFAQSVSEENWQEFRWNENDTFKWNIDQDTVERYFVCLLIFI